MGILDYFSRSSKVTNQPEATEQSEKYLLARQLGKNPFTINKVRSGFYSDNVNRLLNGWTSASNSVDGYLQSQLTSLRARSRELVRQNPYGKRAVNVFKDNIAGNNGVTVHAASKIGKGKNQKLDAAANDSIDAAWNDWANNHADKYGELTFLDMERLAVSQAFQDGEYIFEVVEGRSAGPYGFKLGVIDAELLDVSKNEESGNGGSIRLGVERNKNGIITKYHFRELGVNGQYITGRNYTINASHIIHGFIKEHPDQSRGIPWAHAALENQKSLDSYEEAAMTNARWSASKMAVLSSDGSESDEYVGDTDNDDPNDPNDLEAVEAGAIWDIGTRELQAFDPKYPHEMYSSFTKAQLRAIASGLGISYATLASDLQDVNFSSIRAGVLEDREYFKGLQNWLIQSLVKKVRERWLANAILNESILINGKAPFRPLSEYQPARYQPKRWAWVDPQKDMKAATEAVNYRLKSRSQIIREQGDNPEDVWDEIERENQMLQDRQISTNIGPDSSEQEQSKTEEKEDA